MAKIHLIGIDSSGLTIDKKTIVESCNAVFCARRLKDHLQPLLLSRPDIEVFPISPISEVFSQIDRMPSYKKIALLGGGDPLFFGIGRALFHRFGREVVSVQPAVSSMQMAFARFKIPWDDARFLSVHGRSMEGTFPQIIASNKTFLLTDAQNSPDKIASLLLMNLGEKICHNFTVHVAENLGCNDERLITDKIASIAKGKFSDLSVMIFIREHIGVEKHFGFQEHELAHTRGLITKDEVRAVSLHALCLPKNGVLWDIGAGSGSLSIEAAGIIPSLRVFAIEAKEEQIENIKINRERFMAASIIPIHGEAPDILRGLPDPDRVFIGGSGGRLSEILDQSVTRLANEGIIVINGVLDTTCQVAPEILHKYGLKVSISRVRVTRYSYPDNQSIDFNPISVIKGTKSPV